MCDITKPAPEASLRATDKWSEGFNEDFFSIYRYRVYRTQYHHDGRPKTDITLHSGLTHTEARRLEAIEQAKIEQEPDYRPNTMGRPMALIQMENNTPENRARFEALRKAREQREEEERKAARWAA